MKIRHYLYHRSLFLLEREVSNMNKELPDGWKMEKHSYEDKDYVDYRQYGNGEWNICITFNGDENLYCTFLLKNEGESIYNEVKKTYHNQKRDAEQMALGWMEEYTADSSNSP